MEQIVLQVEGMSCGHCVAAITNAVSALPGVAAVKVDLAAKTAAVEYDPAVCAPDKIKLAIEEQDFSVVG